MGPFLAKRGLLAPFVVLGAAFVGLLIFIAVGRPRGLPSQHLHLRPRQPWVRSSLSPWTRLWKAQMENPCSAVFCRNADATTPHVNAVPNAYTQTWHPSEPLDSWCSHAHESKIGESEDAQFELRSLLPHWRPQGARPQLT
jgi:hypothetical protein